MAVLSTVLSPRASLRTVSISEAIRAEILAHLEEFVRSKPDAWVFTGQRGNPLRRGDFNPRADWKNAVAEVGVPHLHFHDLRHTGNTLAARTNVSTKDPMARMDHASPRAALIYQHATSEADQELASGLNDLTTGERTKKRLMTEEERLEAWRAAASRRSSGQPCVSSRVRWPERFGGLVLGGADDEDEGEAGALAPVG
jgi:hypothetical protein